MLHWLKKTAPARWAVMAFLLGWIANHYYDVGGVSGLAYGVFLFVLNVVVVYAILEVAVRAYQHNHVEGGHRR